MIAYGRFHWIWLVAVSYFVSSSLLFHYTNIDICFPCLWRLLFDMRCLGCGLTHAFLALIHFNFTEAFAENPLIFIVLPASLFYVWQDWRNFEING